MRDETSSLIGWPSNVGVVAVDGGNSDFSGDKYTNGDDTNDSVSSIVNNTDHCVAFFWNKNFDFAFGGVVFAPHTVSFLVGKNLGKYNDKFSSVYTMQPNVPDCKTLLDHNEGYEEL
jgi:hypothetical protein